MSLTLTNINVAVTDIGVGDIVTVTDVDQNKIVVNGIVAMLRSREKSLIPKSTRFWAISKYLYIIRNLCDTTFSGNIELGIR